ncbi:FAD-dependent oxidoreductase [Paenibacillus sp. YN15]|uniref:FAD-dependent oxidoreductase n=1 Tax=Paenibacillus sp. YN15 TaxID=1742774 RepID=UPI000DCCA649|nr:FAD-dependent oxidoreductase [Paenibacillus sp. YN15]RAV04026.1 hypothetical protein DQG13_05970 [Paenibacillus sp. YN15]
MGGMNMKPADVIVLGGGLAGCMAAKHAAELGLRTVVIERRGGLGHELAATGRAWLLNGGTGSELPVLLGSLKKKLLADQLEAGALPLFFSAPAALALGDKRAAGVLIGNQYGLQFLPARAVIDTTAAGVAARLLGGGGDPHSGEAVVRYVAEMENIGYYFEKTMEVPPELGLLDDRITLHEGVRSRSLYVEFSFPAKIDSARRNTKAILASEAKRRAYRLVCWLREHAEFFSGSRLSHLPAEAWVEEQGGDGVAASCPGLYSYSGRLHPKMSTRDMDRLEQETRTLAERVLRELPPEQPSVLRFVSGLTEIPVSACRLSSFRDRGMEVELQRAEFDYGLIRERLEAPVLVAGLGTSGMMAARALWDSGMAALLLEANSELGGTSVVGLVNGYWNGFREGMVRRRDHEVMEISRQVAGTGNATHLSASIIANHLLMEPHADWCHTGTLLCGTLVSADRKARGAVAVDEFGLFAIDADITIDATGDGDAAFLAGCDYEFGDPRDGVTQTASQWGEELWETRTFKDTRYYSDLDAIYNDRYSELLRGICLAHRRNSDYRFSDMLAVRESRRIIGEYQLTVGDIVRGIVPADCVGVTLTPFDFHGIPSSWLANMGLYATHDKLRARIPYRAYLPRGLDGLLVTGKAFSATRDAGCICRMNADLRHAGYTVGLAAAMAFRQGCGVRELDVAALQARLLELGILPEWALEQEAADGTMVFAGGKVELLRTMLAPRKQAVAEGRRLLEQGETQDRLDICKVLAWFEEEDALDEVARRLTELMDAGGMEQPAMSPLASNKEMYLEINHCLALIGKIGNTKYRHVLLRALSLAGPGGPVRHEATLYHQSRIDGWRVPHYSRLMTLAAACERLADRELAPHLERLLDDPVLSGYISPGRHEGVKPFFCSYLELCLSRAAARCGSAAGAERLAGYLEDARYVLSEAAHKELTAITGADLGFDAGRWRVWLQARSPLPPAPYRGPVPGYDIPQ